MNCCGWVMCRFSGEFFGTLLYWIRPVVLLGLCGQYCSLSTYVAVILRARAAFWLSRRALMRWVHRNRSVGIAKTLLGLCSLGGFNTPRHATRRVPVTIKNVAHYDHMTLTLPLFFLKSTNRNVKQHASMLLTQKLSSFLTVPSNHFALRLGHNNDQAGHEPFDKLRANGKCSKRTALVPRQSCALRAPPLCRCAQAAPPT